MKTIVTLLAIALLPALTAAAKKDQKYNPGHYVAIGASMNVRDIKHLDIEALRGVNKRYLWKDLEPARDRYDFSAIRSDLQSLARHNKQLVVFITDKSFSPQRVLPPYLSAYELIEKEGSCAQRWHPVVVERLSKLGAALGREFDMHPNFEGAAIQESALSLSNDFLAAHAYTPEKYRDALILILTSLRESMPHSQVFWYMNFFPQKQDCLREIARAMTPHKIVMGGPDILPYRVGLQRISYPLYKEFRDDLRLFCCAQYDSYRHHKNDAQLSARDRAAIHPEGYVSMEDIFVFARNELCVDYVFWTYKYGGRRGENDYDDAVKVMQEHPAF